MLVILDFLSFVFLTSSGRVEQAEDLVSQPAAHAQFAGPSVCRM